MRIEIDEKSGFCFGVVRAIAAAEKCLAEASDGDFAPLVSLGDIVHNEAEMERLRALGLETASEDSDLAGFAGRRVLIRAHGEPPKTYQLADYHGITLVDATCPVVAALQKTVAAAASTFNDSRAREGKDAKSPFEAPQVVIFGRRGHAEVRGLVAQVTSPGPDPGLSKIGPDMIKYRQNVIVIEGPEELGGIDFGRPIYFLAQTTSSLSEFERLGKEIKKRAQIAGNENVTIHDTICRQVSDHERHLSDFARRHGIVIFVAGAKSSNGRILFSAIEKANPNSHKIQSVSELRPEWFAKTTPKTTIKNTAETTPNSPQSVGVCGATSTPRWLMEQVSEKIAELVRKIE